MLLQAEALTALEGKVNEPFAWDHFESFVFSQDDRLGVGTPVGQKTWFVYDFDPAQHRRAGRRGEWRRARVRPLPVPVPRSLVRSTRRSMHLLLGLSPQGFRLISDDNPAYRAAVSGDPRIDHRVYLNPRRGAGANPRVVAERDREMFAVDLFHKLLRHSQAHHRRETIAFARRSNALLERMALMVVWRNFVKKVSERNSEPLTPAMRAGAADRRWSWGDVLARRRFFGHQRLPEGWTRIYRREWITPAVGRNTLHDLKHAF